MIQEYTPHENEEEPAELDSSELQRRVHLRQQRLSHTIDVLGRELSPARIIERSLDEGSDFALKKLSSSANRTLKHATTKAKANPWPLLLIGAGIIWWLSKSEPEEEETT